MPGPFPGMDPYLEDVSLWPGLHDGMIYTLSTELNAALPEGYYSRRQARLYVVEENRDILPDVIAFHRSPASEGAPSGRGAAGLTAERSAPVVLHIEQEQVSESFIEIRHRSASDKVITVIEILSHTNKAVGTVGNQEYRRKQREILESDVNLIEIDLLRRGSHTAAPPQDNIVRKFGNWDYIVSLSRAQDRTEFELWLLSVRQRLPEIRVPLLSRDEDVLLDLQSAFDRCYDEDRYDRSVRYNGEPSVPLTPDDAVWAAQLLQQHGLRPPLA